MIIQNNQTKTRDEQAKNHRHKETSLMINVGAVTFNN